MLKGALKENYKQKTRVLYKPNLSSFRTHIPLLPTYSFFTFEKQVVGTTVQVLKKTRNTSNADVLQVMSYELKVTSYELKASKQELEFKSASWNIKVQIQELRVWLYELWAQIHELRVEIYEFKNHLINKNSSKQPYYFLIF